MHLGLGLFGNGVTFIKIGNAQLRQIGFEAGWIKIFDLRIDRDGGQLKMNRSMTLEMTQAMQQRE